MTSGTVRILWDSSQAAQVTITGGTWRVGGTPVSFPYALTTSTSFVADNDCRGNISVTLFGVEIAGTPDGVRPYSVRVGDFLGFAPTPDLGVNVGSGGGGGVSSWNDLEDKPAFIAAGTDVAAARTTLGLTDVAVTGSYNDLADVPPDGFQPSLDNLPAGSMVARVYASGAYPARGTSRTDLIFNWIGPVPPTGDLGNDVWDEIP